MQQLATAAGDFAPADRFENDTTWSGDAVRARQEQLLDEGLMETFPASDPVAIVRLT